MTAVGAGPAVVPEFVVLEPDSPPATLYRPPRMRADRACVLVLAGPGEPRSGYARLYRYLARDLHRSGVATLVLESDLRARPDAVAAWRTRVSTAEGMLERHGLRVLLAVARGLSCAALSASRANRSVGLNPVSRRPGPDQPRTAAELLSFGFEEVWLGSEVPRALAGAVAADPLPVGPPGWTVVPYAEPGRPPERRREGLVIHPPPSVRDPLFRRVWESAWLRATLVSMAHDG